MTDATNPRPPAGPPALPPIVFPPPPDAKKSGVLKWGLIGCAGASVIVIAGLVFLMTHARSITGWALAKLEETVLTGCAPDVTAEEKTELRTAFQRFRRAAAEDKATPEQVEEIQRKVTAALRDGRVTPAEIRDLTAELKKAFP